MTYQHFAYIYDDLMKDVPYSNWITYFLDSQRLYDLTNNQQKILDLGCGTGSISIPLAQRGYDVTGVDISSEMLTVAEEKARKQGLSITFYEQDMSDLSLDVTYDFIICFCDSLNYLTDEQAVIQTFENAYKHLNHGGLFLFDVHSIEKVQNIFQDQTFVSSEEDVAYIWNCFAGEHPYSVEHELSFFVKELHTNLYKRYDELHLQRTFPINQYQEWLEHGGFNNIIITSDFQNELSTMNRERILFSCQKK
ncbi:class I SAM-dependent DNA methyltransferase [Bacillus salitolerans]|uniref:Class I SAM-dependent DNA methyltransferase n=1 Tax=Bacillus salitolerans TaxID=1437434 RepID=A0ABW4LNA7_9BACI